MLDQEALSHALQAVYEAPLDPSKWTVFLKRTSGLIGAEDARLLLHDATNSPSVVVRHWSATVRPDAVPESHAREPGPSIESISEVSDWLGGGEQTVLFTALQGVQFCTEFPQPAGMPHGIFSVAERSPSRLAFLSFHRRKGPFQESELDTVRTLSSHLRQAHRLYSRLVGSSDQTASLQSALNSVAMGVILLSAKGRIITLNSTAERLLASHDTLVATRDGLRAQRPDESARLDKLVEQATTASENQALKGSGLMTISRLGKPGLLLLASPVRGLQGEQRHQVRAIIFVSDPAERVRPTHATLHALYRLTPAEYRLAMLLADGQEPGAIAETIGVSRNTLKTQLSAIYRKTGTCRQAQLVRLLLQLPTASQMRDNTPLTVQAAERHPKHSSVVVR